jgi:LPXTG-motif cell wall-anchored protein
MKRKRGMPFVALGLAFLAIGASGQRAFLAMGLAFLAIGIVFLVRQKRTGNNP